MARVKRRPGIGRVTRYCVPVAAPSGPTVLLDANWATDTILDDGLVPIADGNPVDVWTMATGGEWNYTQAAVAGASARPIWVAASGVHTAGNNAALTTATPITIPALATADWDIWVYCVVPASGVGSPIGKSTSITTWPRIEIQAGTGPVIVDDNGDGASDGSASMAAGARLVRFGNTAGALNVAWTGEADHAMDMEGYAGTFTFDSLFAQIAIAVYSATGFYLKVLRIVTYPTGYADRASYRSTVETAIAGAPLT